jgi:NAD(P)-dependent dehydrogenase (short-subunit alcohol dehydrogenase family)
MTTPNPSTWLITGCSTGFGRELVALAARSGARVAATARRPESIADLSQQFPGHVVPIELDVRSPDQARRAVSEAVAALGSLDVVVNNAGYGLFGAVEEVSDQQARDVFDTNVFGVLNVLRAALPVLRRQRRGHVIQMSSVYGQYAHAGVGLLGASKFAVEGLSEALAEELAPLGIRVTLVEPGFHATSFLANLQVADRMADYEQSVGAVQRSLGELPAGALDDPAQVARAILAAVNADSAPLRLTIGAAAREGIGAALVRRGGDLTITEPATAAG